MNLLLGGGRYNIKLSLDYFLGILVAIPFSYPNEPLYWFGLTAFILALPRMKFGKSAWITLSLILLFLSTVVVANLISPFQDSIQIFSIAGTFLTMGCFMFRYCVMNLEEFLSGFLVVIGIYTLLTFIAFFVLEPYQYGFGLFVDSNYRMWAEGFLIEWPNVFCVFLVLGAYINWIRSNGFLASLNILAAVLTTSRMGILAIAIFALFFLLKRKLLPTATTILIMLLVSALATYLISSNNDVFLDYVSQRLFKISDRELIFNDMVTVFADNIFGVGNISFGEISELYTSYHSSFLKALIRYGIVGFIIYLLLILPRNPLWKLRAKENAPIVFFLVAGLVQDMLFHIHLVIMYSVLLEYREVRMRRERGNLVRADV